jgi:hypothetical protein
MQFPLYTFHFSGLRVAPTLHLRQPRAAMATMQQRHGCLGQTHTMTLRIERSARQGMMVFTLSGRMKAEEVAELKALFATDYRSIVLDLRDVRLADRDAVKFLRDCQADGMKLENCPAYVREWMEREKD